MATTAQQIATSKPKKAPSTKPLVDDAAKVEKKLVEQKPERPDEDKFRAALATAEKELAAAKADYNAAREKLNAALPPSKDSNAPLTPDKIRQNEIKTELNTLRGEQSSFKAAKSKIREQIDALDKDVKAKIAEQKNARAKIPYRSVADIDAQITKLDNQVESGSMKLVDERKALADISTLRKHRKTLVALDEAQKAIDADKARIAELRQQLVEDPEQKAVSDRYNALNAEFDAIKARQDAAYKQLSVLRDAASAARKAEQEKFQAKKRLEDDFYQARNAFRAYERKARQIREERYKAERAAREKEHKRQVAQQKMEEASRKAFLDEITTCENLIAFFDPSSAEAQARRSTGGAKAGGSALAATASRVVSELPVGKALARKDDRLEEESYFVSGKGKKARKNANKGSGANTPTPAATPAKPATPSNDDGDEDAAAPAAGKRETFSLNHGVLVQLGEVDVRAPVGADDVPAVVEQLRKKLEWYRENSDRVTAENIAKAQKEIDRLNAVGEGTAKAVAEAQADADVAEKTDGAPAADAAATAPAADEGEEEKPLPVPEALEEGAAPAEAASQ